MTKKMTIELPDGVTTKLEGTSPKFLILLDIDTPEAADELIERVEKAKAEVKRPAGMPEDGQEYWVIYADGAYVQEIWCNSPFDRDCWQMGNVFLTEAECVAEIDRRKALQRVKVWKRDNLPQLPRKLEYPDAVFELSVMRELSIPDQLRLIESCESDLRTLAGVK